MNRHTNLLGHPYWTGVGAIAAIFGAFFAFKQSESGKTDPGFEVATIPAIEASDESPEKSPADQDKPPLKATPVIFPNLRGQWKIKNIISETSFKPFRGLIVHYLVQVEQDANTITLTGEKDGEIYKAEESKYTGSARTRIEGAGKLVINQNGGFDLSVEYQEESTSKGEDLDGLFELTIVATDKLRGEVRCEAATSRGESVWTMIEAENADVAQARP